MWLCHSLFFFFKSQNSKTQFCNLNLLITGIHEQSKKSQTQNTNILPSCHTKFVKMSVTWKFHLLHVMFINSSILIYKMFSMLVIYFEFSMLNTTLQELRSQKLEGWVLQAQKDKHTLTRLSWNLCIAQRNTLYNMCALSFNRDTIIDMVSQFRSCPGIA